MAPALLFITGVLAGLIAGFILSRLFGRTRSSVGSGEARLLEERLLKADQGMEQFSRQLEAQSSELKAVQLQAQQASEQAAVSRTQLEGVSQERDALKAGHDTALAAMDQLRREKETLTATMAEVAEKLRSQESQTQFLEQARTDLLTQFRSLSGQMLDGSREALLKSTKETVSEPFAKEVLQLRQQVAQTLAVRRGFCCNDEPRALAADQNQIALPAEPMIHCLAVSGYRSLQHVVVPFGQLTLVTGANGSGKSNLYRSLRLLTAAARGTMVGALAQEGGLPAVMWAGPERLSRAMRQGEQPVQGGPRQQAVRLRLGFAAEPFSYAVELGYPQERQSAFALDPQLKGEWIWAGKSFHPRAVLSSSGAQPDPDQSIFQRGFDPEQQPEVMLLREQILSWRFYDSFRTDPGAPARQPRVGTRCFALSGDGADLPAAVQTILENGDGQGLQQAMDDAFPGCHLSVHNDGGLFRLHVHQPGLLRPLEAAELSDGTLRYLLLTVALFSPRLPPLLVLNEPESSLHPELLAPLARLIHAAAERTQVWVIAHAPALIQVLAEQPHCRHLQLEREQGATQVQGQTTIERGSWRWPG